MQISVKDCAYPGDKGNVTIIYNEGLKSYSSFARGTISNDMWGVEVDGRRYAVTLVMGWEFTPEEFAKWTKPYPEHHNAVIEAIAKHIEQVAIIRK